MIHFAYGPVAANVLTAREVLRVFVAADAPTAPTGFQRIDITAIVGEGNPNAFVGRMFNIETPTAPALLDVVSTLIADQQARIHLAARQGFENNLRHWPHFSANGEQSSTAVDRWIVHYGAAVDMIVRGAWRDGSGSLVVHTPEHRESVVAAIEQTMGGTNPTSRGDIPTWYQVMEGDATLRTQWRTAGVTAGSLIYADFLTATGDLRTPDGAFTATGNTIPTGFDIDSPTLRAA